MLILNPNLFRTFAEKKDMETYQSRERRLSNTIKPAEMGLEEWQVALRRQQAQRERFIISELGAPFSPENIRFATQSRAASTRSSIEVPTVLGTIVLALTSAHLASALASTWRA